MQFKKNDRVKIKVDRDFGPDHVPRGTAGTITQVVPAGDAYWVRFDNMDRDVLVPADILEPLLGKKES